MRNDKEVIRVLRKVGAIITDSHFVYTSGKHGSVYIRKDKLYPHTALTSKISKLIAKEVKNWSIDVVVGPSMGGVILSQWIAYHISKMKKKEILSVFTEKSYDGKKIFDRSQVFKRGYDDLVKDKSVLVVEDLTNTGSSVRKVVDRVREIGGKVKGVYVLVNRVPDKVNSKYMKAPFFSLAVYKAEAYDEKNCPLCKKNIPINTEVGHGKEFLEKRRNKI